MRNLRTVFYFILTIMVTSVLFLSCSENIEQPTAPDGNHSGKTNGRGIMRIPETQVLLNEVYWLDNAPYSTGWISYHIGAGKYILKIESYDAFYGGNHGANPTKIYLEVRDDRAPIYKKIGDGSMQVANLQQRFFSFSPYFGYLYHRFQITMTPTHTPPAPPSIAQEIHLKITIERTPFVLDDYYEN